MRFMSAKVEFFGKELFEENVRLFEHLGVTIKL